MDLELGRFDSPTLCEWIPGNHVLQVGSCAQGDAGPKADLLLDCFLDAPCQGREVLRVGLENNVAALNVGLGRAQAERFAELAQCFHWHLVIAGDVYATEQGNKNGHDGVKHNAARGDRRILLWALGQTAPLPLSPLP